MKRFIRGTLSAALFAGWAWAVTLIVSTGAENWLEFTGGAVFGMMLMGWLNYIAWRLGGFREEPTKLQLFRDDGDP